MKVIKTVRIEENILEVIEEKFPSTKFSKVVNKAIFEYLDKHGLISEEIKSTLISDSL